MFCKLGVLNFEREHFPIFFKFAATQSISTHRDIKLYKNVLYNLL